MIVLFSYADQPGFVLWVSSPTFSALDQPITMGICGMALCFLSDACWQSLRLPGYCMMVVLLHLLQKALSYTKLWVTQSSLPIVSTGFDHNFSLFQIIYISWILNNSSQSTIQKSNKLNFSQEVKKMIQLM